MKILIVEDSKFTQKVLMSQIDLCFSDAEFLSANNGLQGFEIYKKEKPHVVITDLLMPDSTGNELIENIRKNDSKTHIIVVSADIQESVKREIESFGILTFINKPFNAKKAQQICELLKEHSYD